MKKSKINMHVSVILSEKTFN